MNKTKNDNIYNYNNIADIANIDDNKLFDILGQIDDIGENDNLQLFEQKSTQINNNFCDKCQTDTKTSNDIVQGVKICVGCGTILSQIFDDNINSELNNKKGFHMIFNSSNSFLFESIITQLCGNNM